MRISQRNSISDNVTTFTRSVSAFNSSHHISTINNYNIPFNNAAASDGPSFYIAIYHRSAFNYDVIVFNCTSI